MQISPINNNQTNFKGQMIFKAPKQCVRLGKNAHPLCFLSIMSEDIKSIDHIDTLGRRARNKLKKEFTGINKKLAKYIDAFEEYITVIRTLDGKTYMVKNSPESIEEATRRLNIITTEQNHAIKEGKTLQGSTNFIEING